MCWSRTSSTETETRKQTMSSSASWHYNSLAFNEASSVNQLQTEMQLASTTKPIIAARRRRGNVMPSDRYRYNIRYLCTDTVRFWRLKAMKHITDSYANDLFQWFESVKLCLWSSDWLIPTNTQCRGQSTVEMITWKSPDTIGLIWKCKTVYRACLIPVHKSFVTTYDWKSWAVWELL